MQKKSVEVPRKKHDNIYLGSKALYKYMKAFMFLDKPTLLDVLRLFLNALASICLTKSHCHSLKLFFYWKRKKQHPVGFHLSTRNMAAAPVWLFIRNIQLVDYLKKSFLFRNIELNTKV